MDDLVCPACGHAWDVHPGAGAGAHVDLDLVVCAACVYEEDYDLRASVDMCSRDSPAASGPLPPGRLRVRIARPLLRGYRVYIEDRTGMRWAMVTPSENSQESAERTAASIKADIAVMSVKGLRKKYRRPAR